MKHVIRKWGWVPLLVVALTLSVYLVILIVRQNSPASTTDMMSAQMGQDIAKLAARDGKTQTLNLISQRGSHSFMVEIASTPASRTKGLSGRDSLAHDTGMLFEFSEHGNDCFWMKDMKFNIDILWFDENQNLIHVQESAKKESYPSDFCPQTPSSYVLEVPAGTVQQLSLQLGDRFIIP